MVPLSPIARLRSIEFIPSCGKKLWQCIAYISRSSSDNFFFFFCWLLIFCVHRLHFATVKVYFSTWHVYRNDELVTNMKRTWNESKWRRTQIVGDYNAPHVVFSPVSSSSPFFCSEVSQFSWRRKSGYFAGPRKTGMCFISVAYAAEWKLAFSPIACNWLEKHNTTK